jgi:hypothetical protein
MSQGFAVEGYVLCARGAHVWVRSEVASRLGGVCHECFAAEGGQTIRTIELVGRGMRINIPLNKRSHRKRQLSDSRLARKKLSLKARDSARKRLSAIFSDMYDILLAEERAKLGLEPWPVEIAARGRDASAEFGFAAMISELDTRGVNTK